MGKRGPKAGGRKAVGAGKGAATAQYLASAGRGLTPAERKVWDHTVRGMDPGFYREADAQLLKEHAQAVVFRDQYKAKVDEALATGDLAGVERWGKRWDKSAAMVLSLSPRLKLGPAARETNRRTTNASRLGISAKKSERAGLYFEDTAGRSDEEASNYGTVN